MLDVCRTIARLRDEGQPAALATVVAKKGSAPREPGAKMVVTADGRIFGTVGGGCPEAEVQRAAMDVILAGAPRLVRVDLTADTAVDEGAICGGTMDVFIEMVSSESYRGSAGHGVGGRVDNC